MRRVDLGGSLGVCDLKDPDASGVDVKTKDKVREILARLPNDCSLEDVLYHLYVLQKTEEGVADLKAGRTIPHAEVVEELETLSASSTGK